MVLFDGNVIGDSTEGSRQFNVCSELPFKVKIVLCLLSKFKFRFLVKKAASFLKSHTNDYLSKIGVEVGTNAVVPDGVKYSLALSIPKVFRVSSYKNFISMSQLNRLVKLWGWSSVKYFSTPSAPDDSFKVSLLDDSILIDSYVKDIIPKESVWSVYANYLNGIFEVLSSI